MVQVLPNGIVLPSPWPPTGHDPRRRLPMPVPYLEQPPPVIDIAKGRQLFVDPFLLAESSLVTAQHQPVKYPGNPVFFPQTVWERNDELPPCTVPKCGGLWYDEQTRNLRMWYMASYLGVMCHAHSDDGIHWTRTPLDIVPGTNLILPTEFHPDSGTVFIDHETKDPATRYKMLIREPNPPGKGFFPAHIFTSPDGYHWKNEGQTGPMDDRSTMFYNPFSREWVQSIRSWVPPIYRSRRYWAHADFVQSARWEKGQPPLWLGADCLDLPGDDQPQLYNFDAIAYESVMLGLFQILRGPPNRLGEATGTPKLTELCIGYSRDGYHWHRPRREPFIGARREPGSWERGYVESTGGLCIIMGDELWFYYSAYAGDPTRLSTDWHRNGTYANGAMGLAKLRRDGFVSLQARFPGAMALTRPVVFTGDCFFVNANTAGAELRVAVLDEAGQPISGLGTEDCLPFVGNSTCARLRWRGEASLATWAGRPVRLRFSLDRGDLYSFWITPHADGTSGGYQAAGAVPGIATSAVL